MTRGRGITTGCLRGTAILSSLADPSPRVSKQARMVLEAQKALPIHDWVWEAVQSETGPLHGRMTENAAADRQHPALVQRQQVVQSGAFARLPGPQQRGLSGRGTRDLIHGKVSRSTDHGVSPHPVAFMLIDTGGSRITSPPRKQTLIREGEVDLRGRGRSVPAYCRESVKGAKSAKWDCVRAILMSPDEGVNAGVRTPVRMLEPPR